MSMDDWKITPAADLNLSPMARWRSYARENGLVATASRLCWWTGMKTMLKVWHRLDVRGREHLPKSPSFVLVANHASHLDAIVLGATLPLAFRDQLFPLAAGDVFFEAPALAAFSATVLNALPVWRKNVGRHAMDSLRARLLELPTIYILFPEGARSRDGKMLPFKPGVGMIVAGTSIPVIPCGLQGAFEALPFSAKVPRPYRIRVRIGEPRVFADISNTRDGWNEITRLLESDVTALTLQR